MAYTLAEVTSFYNSAKAAYTAALTAVSYSIKDRNLQRARVEILRNEMNYWKIQLDDLTAGYNTKIKVSRFVPIDD